MPYSLDIEGIPIEFPYQPYPCQIEYLKKLVKAFELGWNGLLESPTGTGKTLCLLCGALGWLRHKKNKLQAMTKFGENEDVIDLLLVPKIIYSSRTHAQLSQVIRELNKTSYVSDMKMCVLGSRDNMCLHEDVKNETNSMIKNNMCRMKVTKRTCLYWNNLESRKELTKSKSVVKIMDIEDLMAFSAKQKICPYYKSRNDMEGADIILMPYNYILDARTRKANKIDLKGNIVIFDEAHNLEKICEESASVSLRSRDVALCIREIKSTLSQLQKRDINSRRIFLVSFTKFAKRKNCEFEIFEEAEEAFRKEMDACGAVFGQASAASEEPQKDIDVNDVAHALMLLQSLEENMDKIDLKETDGKSRVVQNLPGRIYAGNFMMELLQKAGILDTMRDPITLLLDKMANFLTLRSTGAGSLALNRGLHLQAFGSFLATVYHKDTLEAHVPNRITNDKSQTMFLTYITEDEPPKKKGQLSMSDSTNKQGIVINYWCFSAGLGMQELCKREVRSVIITSGTLAPINHFANDMKIPLPLTLENGHVIENNQVWCGILNRGPDNTQLNSSYQNRDNVSYVSSLGNALVNVARICPQGMLIFFASYSQMNSCVQKWKDHKIWERIDNLKRIYVEPREKGQFGPMMTQFNDDIQNGSGAIFMAVCRGKLSEGMDFADKHGRCVVIAGIPYPPLMDARVCLKREYLNNLTSEDKQVSKQTGQSWYQMEAVRAVNQAMGRVIRHKDDFGAILLADSRFNSWSNDQLPSWLRPVMMQYQKFGDMQQSLSNFFKAKGISGGRTAIRPSKNQCAFGNDASRKVVKRKFEDASFCCSDSDFGQNSQRIAGFGCSQASQGLSQITENDFVRGLEENAVNSTFRDDKLFERKRKELDNLRKPKINKDFSVFDAFNDGNVSSPSSIMDNPKVDLSDFGALYKEEPQLKEDKSAKKGNRIKLQVNATTVKKVVQGPKVTESPYELNAVTFSKQVKAHLPKNQHNQFTNTLIEYRAGRMQFQTLVTHMKEYLLPDRLDLFKGFCSFVKKEHRKEYKTICEVEEFKIQTADL